MVTVSCHIHRTPPLTSVHGQYKILCLKYYIVGTKMKLSFYLKLNKKNKRRKRKKKRKKKGTVHLVEPLFMFKSIKSYILNGNEMPSGSVPGRGQQNRLALGIQRDVLSYAEAWANSLLLSLLLQAAQLWLHRWQSCLQLQLGHTHPQVYHGLPTKEDKLCRSKTSLSLAHDQAYLPPRNGSRVNKAYDVFSCSSF